jgi:chromosomal replication initiator protein
MPGKLTQVASLTLQIPGSKRRSTWNQIATSILLDAFLLGPENAAAFDLFSSESIADLESSSPILLYGATGVGKTSLGLTLASRWSHDSKDRKVQAVSASDFARAFQMAIEADDMPRFRTQYRQCDCLMLDNLHELAGKESIQSELTELMSVAERTHQLIILTSQVLPGLNSQWNDALVSRILCGYSLEILPPSESVRLEAFRYLASVEGISIEDRELERINATLPSDYTIVQLKGLVSRWTHQHKLNSVLSQSNKSNRPLPELDHSSTLKRLVQSHAKSLPAPTDIAKSVAR